MDGLTSSLTFKDPVLEVLGDTDESDDLDDDDDIAEEEDADLAGRPRIIAMNCCSCWYEKLSW